MSQPLGADVELDGRVVGRTPLVERRELPPTDYVLRITKPGFQPWRRVVRPDDGGSLSVTAVLLKRGE